MADDSRLDRHRRPLASLDGRTRFVLFAFALLAAQSLVVGVTKTRIPRHGSAIGLWIGFVLLFILLAVLVISLVRGRRWAWLAFVALYGVSLVVDVVNLSDLVEFSLALIRFMLLMSRPMRHHVCVDKFSWRGWRVV
jgi:hypothetical protein